LAQHAEPGAVAMCGRQHLQTGGFLAREMPELEKFFHYRNLDVSSSRNWPGGGHRRVRRVKRSQSTLALEDVRDSIRELAYYRERCSP